VEQQPSRAEILGGGKTQGGIAEHLANPQGLGRDLRDEQTPEKGGVNFGLRRNFVRGRALEESVQRSEGNKTSKGNPKSGTEMK